jgi:hypothetical protein
MKARAHVQSAALSVLVLAALITACRSSAPESARGPMPARGFDAGETAPRGLEACIDTWLRENKLDPYGNPEGTMYAGGTPLFDERTGERKERVSYVLEHHAEARRACGDAGPQ